MNIHMCVLDLRTGRDDVCVCYPLVQVVPLGIPSLCRFLPKTLGGRALRLTLSSSVRQLKLRRLRVG